MCSGEDATCETAFPVPDGRVRGRCRCGLPWFGTAIGRCLDGTCRVNEPAEGCLYAGTDRGGMQVLSDRDVAATLSLADVVPAVERAFRKQGRGAVERPERPHFPVGIGLGETEDDTGEGSSESTAGESAEEGDEHEPADWTEPAGTGLAMPAYIHGDSTYATKLVGVHPNNAARGLPTVQAQLVVTDAATGRPRLLAAAERVTNSRTGVIGGLAARELAPDGPVRIGLLGAGSQARWQTRAIAHTRTVESVQCYSPSESREACAADLREAGLDAGAVESPTAAVENATVVVTATTASEPVFPGERLREDALVIAVGAYTADTQELDRTTFDRASRVYADVPEEVAEIGDVLNNGVDPERLVPLSVLFDEQASDPHDAVDESSDEAVTDGGITVVESVGSAVLDAAVGELLAERVGPETGTSVEL